MTPQDPSFGNSEHTTLRAPSSLVAFWAVVGITALLMGDAAVRGAWGFVGRWLPLALLIIWVFWLLLWRSSIRVESAQVVVTNLLRVHVVPWSSVIEVIQGPQIRLELRDGSRIDCWGGPFPPRSVMRRHLLENEAVNLMEATRESAPRSADTPRAYWDMPVLAVGCILLVWTALAVTLMRQ